MNFEVLPDYNTSSVSQDMHSKDKHHEILCTDK